MSNVGLVLGLTFGVFGTCIGYICYRYCRRSPAQSLQEQDAQAVQSVQSVQSMKPMQQREYHTPIKDALTPRAFDDLQKGYLSNYLKDELMVYRLRQKRDLVEFIEYAKGRGYIPIMDFCRNLDPPNYPSHIFYKIAGLPVANANAEETVTI